MPRNKPQADSVRLSRRDLMRGASTALVGMALVAIAASRAAGAEKVSKDQVSYQDSPQDGQRCADCRFFQDGACERVEGEISPDGYCTLWSPKQD